MALHTGFEPASPFRPTVFKTASSPPRHAAIMELDARLELVFPAWRAGTLTLVLIERYGGQGWS